ncbi:MAG: hypothetical protein HDQ88_03770 [Clostridia bacterium]|nr:hypothetical protein [Clostridia bacterium]
MAEMTLEEKVEFATGIVKTFIAQTREYLAIVEQLFKNNRDVMSVADVGLVMSVAIQGERLCQVIVGSSGGVKISLESIKSALEEVRK